MNTNNLVEWTSIYWWTFERATELANDISKGKDILGDSRLYANLKNQYITAIKDIPNNPECPEECWAVTNKYDPRIAALRK